MYVYKFFYFFIFFERKSFHLKVRRYETAVVWKTNQRYEILNMCTCVRTCGSVRVCMYYRKRGNASYIVREVLSVRERERGTDRDGSDVTIIALKLAMNLHFSLPNFAQLAMSLHFPLPKIRTFRFSLHTSRLSLRGEVTIVALKFAMSSHFPLPTFPCQKFALFVSPFTLPVSPFAERSPLWRWNSQRVHTFHCQKCFRPQALFPSSKNFFALRLGSPSFKWHEPRDEW